MSDNYGFKRAERKERKPLDFSGLPKAPPSPSPEKEAAAMERGEALGFVGRDPMVPGESGPGVIIAPPVVRDQMPFTATETSQAEAPLRVEAVKSADGLKPAIARERRVGGQTRSIYIKGPVNEIDAFIQFVNEQGYSAYWEAIRDLMAFRAQNQEELIPDNLSRG